MVRKNGPNRSCLLPFKDQIFHAWFDERKTAKEIQAMLKNSGLEVADSTIIRFIHVRNRPTPLPAITKIDTKEKETSAKVECICPHCGKKIALKLERR